MENFQHSKNESETKNISDYPNEIFSIFDYFSNIFTSIWQHILHESNNT